MTTESKSQIMKYSDILDRVNAAERLEWEAANLHEWAGRRHANLSYFAAGGAITVAGLIAATVSNIFEGFDSIIHSFTFLIISIPALAFILFTYIREWRSVIALKEDAHYRESLAQELVRPVRDTLYVTDKAMDFDPHQLAALEIRLSRFKLDRNSSPFRGSTQKREDAENDQ